jgi:predicted nucleic acid-binding protein
MILADTSVWISHLRRSDPTLVKLLNGEVLMHPFVLGELACGNLKERPKILAHLAALPSAIVATDAQASWSRPRLDRRPPAGFGPAFPLPPVDNRQAPACGIGAFEAHLAWITCTGRNA